MSENFKAMYGHKLRKNADGLEKLSQKLPGEPTDISEFPLDTRSLSPDDFPPQEGPGSIHYKRDMRSITADLDRLNRLDIQQQLKMQHKDALEQKRIESSLKKLQKEIREIEAYEARGGRPEHCKQKNEASL